MKNKDYMKQIANMLGVKLHEEFKTTNSLKYVTFRLTEDGLFDCFGNKSRETLAMILEGTIKIIKLPWEPKNGEHYYYIRIWEDEEPTVEQSYWGNGTWEYGLYSTGNFFKTRKEAFKNINNFKKFMKSTKPNMSWKE